MAKRGNGREAPGRLIDRMGPKEVARCLSEALGRNVEPSNLQHFKLVPMPEPVQKLSRGELYLAPEIEAWAKEYARISARRG